MNTLILAAALLGTPQCADGQCTIQPVRTVVRAVVTHQPVRRAVRAVAQRQPVRRFFCKRRPVRRLVGAVLRPRCRR